MDWQLQTAKNRLSALIDRVEEGEEQIITRHGRPVAVVVPYALWQQRCAGDGQTAYTAFLPPEEDRGADLAETVAQARADEPPSRPVVFE